MVKALAALWLVFAAVCVSPRYPAPAVATFPHMDSVRVMLSTDANEQLEALADLTRRTRREQAACVTDYAYLPTGKAKWIVALLELGPSRPYLSDSLKIWTKDQKPFCDAGGASVHTHVVRNETWGKPSEWDMTYRFEWTEAPFKVLVSVGARRPSKVTVYGLR